MQASQWTSETILFFAVAIIVFAAIGYLLAALIQSRKAAQLSTQLEQKQLALEKVSTELNTRQALLETSQSQIHQQQLSESKLQEKLKHSEENRIRLEKTLETLQQTLESEDQKRQASIEAHHQLGKAHETALAEARARKEQIADLRQRLQSNEAALMEERGQINRLSDALAQEGKKAKGLEAADKEAREQLQEAKTQLNAAHQKHDALQTQISELKSQYTKLKTEQEEREASHLREVATFEKQKASLSEQFKLLSNEILEAKSKALQENSKMSLSAVMNPFQQSIDGFKKEIQDIHHRETTQQGELRKELEALKELNQKITTEAHELSTALRGQKKLQGNWGELILENVLDRSGLQLGKDYQREASFKTEEGRQRPDAVVYLPQNRHLIIDAKVSLNAYTRFVNAEDEAEQKLALKEHVQAVASRIKELADRDYYKLPGLKSPEMVFMFIPIESAFVEALKEDETLFQSAIENNVLVATPTTLLTSLNIVRQLWRYEDQNKHTAELARKADNVFRKLNTFLNSFENIKKGLDRASEAYIKAENQLVSGKGNLVKQVGEFKNLAPAIKAELPEYFTGKASLEVDFIPAESETLDSEDIEEKSSKATPINADIQL